VVFVGYINTGGLSAGVGGGVLETRMNNIPNNELEVANEQESSRVTGCWIYRLWELPVGNFCKKDWKKSNGEVAVSNRQLAEQ